MDKVKNFGSPILRYKGLTKKKIEEEGYNYKIEAKDSIELWKGLIGLIKGEIEKSKLKI